MSNGVTADVLEKVREWLKTQGQHLEFQVAERFARAGSVSSEESTYTMDGRVLPPC
jgi:hypothetical protein